MSKEFEIAMNLLKAGDRSLRKAHKDLPRAQAAILSSFGILLRLKQPPTK